jgi:fructokinase
MLLQKNILIFGEVLFDDFGKQNTVLGGAPFNVAWHLQGFGLNPVVISRIGTDRNGEEVKRRMRRWGLSAQGIQIDNSHPTGLVRVETVAGEPRFTILPDQAYDFIDAVETGKLIKLLPYQIVYYGTLALRNEISHTALKTIMRKKGIRIFLDVNLREPWWRAETIVDHISRATWVKGNADELKIIADIARIKTRDIEQIAVTLCQEYDIDYLFVTLGANGAFIADAAGRVYRSESAPVVSMVDSVGAGDGFSAVSILGLLHGWDMDTLLDRANNFASEICRVRGATIDEKSFYKNILKQWGNPELYR